MLFGYPAFKAPASCRRRDNARATVRVRRAWRKRGWPDGGRLRGWRNGRRSRRQRRALDALDAFADLRLEEARHVVVDDAEETLRRLKGERLRPIGRVDGLFVALDQIMKPLSVN
jgi:hypothetical protein